MIAEWILLFFILYIASIVYESYAIKKKNENVNFEGKTVMITGASSGIGKQLALDFNRLGATVIICARSVDELKRIKDEEMKDSSKTHVYFMDLEKIENLKDLALEIDSKHKVDILINNGGTSMREEFINLELSMVSRMMKVNFLSCVALSRYIGEGMSKRGGGQIVNVISVAGLFPVPLRTIYSASKYATNIFSSSMRAEFKDHNISVTDIYPGYVQTNISKNALVGDGSSFGKQDENIGKGMKVDEACRIMLNGIYSKRHRIVICEFKIKLAIFLSNLNSDLMNLFSKIKYKSQIEVMKKAK